MFGFFSNKKKNSCPIDEEMRIWMENAFLWLIGEFGKDKLLMRQTVVPTAVFFPFRFDGAERSLHSIARVVANQMEISMDQLELSAYEQGLQEFEGGFGTGIWTESDKTTDSNMAAGLYFGRNERGKFEVMVEVTGIKNFEMLAGVLAHEFSHIKLLGEDRLDLNDEYLTDLTTVVFGLGIFNANLAFTSYQSNAGWGHSSAGYLKQREWGYALALYAYFRNEENPDWVKFLNKNIQTDFKKSTIFIKANPDLIFKEKKKGLRVVK